jgi:hypothetical protein
MLAGALAACNSDSQTASIGQPEFVKEFKSEGSARLIENFSCDEIGLNSLKVVDSLLVIGHNGNWSIYSINNWHKYGNCLSRGESAKEFLYVPRCASAAYTVESDSLIAYISDEYRNRIMRFNISDFIATGQESVIKALSSEHLSSSTWDVTVCNATDFLMAQPNDNFTGFSRELCCNDIVTEIESTKSLSQATVSGDDKINVLAKVTRFDPSAEMFVEAMSYLNQINIYSKDGLRGKTICVGSKLDDINKIDRFYSINRTDTYASVSAWPFGFGAIYYGSEKPSTSEIQFFDWDGHALYRLKVPFPVLAFDIDVANRRLYAIDSNNDILTAIDASAVLQAMGQ